MVLNFSFQLLLRSEKQFKSGRSKAITFTGMTGQFSGKSLPYLALGRSAHHAGT